MSTMTIHGIIYNKFRYREFFVDYHSNFVLIEVEYTHMEVEKAITHIALVNDDDQIVGYEDKLKVHQEGLM